MNKKEAILGGRNAILQTDHGRQGEGGALSRDIFTQLHFLSGQRGGVKNRVEQHRQLDGDTSPKMLRLKTSLAGLHR